MEFERINELGKAIKTIGEIHDEIRDALSGRTAEPAEVVVIGDTEEQKQRELLAVQTVCAAVAERLLDAPESDKLGPVEENTTKHEQTTIRKIQLPDCTLSLHKMIAFGKEGEMPENPEPSYDIYADPPGEHIVDDVNQNTPYGSFEAIARVEGVGDFPDYSLDERIRSARDSLQSFNKIAEYCGVEPITAADPI